MKKARNLLIAVLFVTISALPALAKYPVLFDGIELGTPDKVVMETAEGADNCTGDPNDLSIICLEETEMAGMEGVAWEVELHFTKGKLTGVKWITSFDQERFVHLKNLIMQDDFCVEIAGNGYLLDIVNLVQVKPKEHNKIATEFELKALAEGNISYSFLRKDGIKPTAKKAKNLREFTAHLDPEILQTTLIKKTTNGIDGKTYVSMAIQQTFPILVYEIVKK